MNVVTKSEWNDWQSHKVTKAFKQAVLERIEETKDVLSTSAGIDSNNDRLLVGIIHAYRECLDFRVDFEVEE